MAEERWEIRIAGFGGQGIVLMGYLIGKAAALFDRLESCVSQSYGPEARGGTCRADVVISAKAVHYPMVTRPDVLILMSQEAFSKYGTTAQKDALVLVDADLVKEGGSHWKVPATRIAEELGSRLGANTVMLGALAALKGLVSISALEDSIRTTVRPRFVDYNLKAFAGGVDCGRRLAEERPARPDGATLEVRQ